MTGKLNSTASCPHCAAKRIEPTDTLSYVRHDLGEPLITVDHVSMGWDGRRVLDDVSLTVHRGDFIAITGPNGGGKTTLLRIILGLLKPTSGRVVHCVEGLRIGYLPQKNQIDSRFPISVTEVVESGLLGVSGLSRSERRERVEEMIRRVGLESHARNPIGALSGGQLQRALLGRALVSRPELLVLDEPLSYVDKQFEQRIYDIVGALAGDVTILLVSHEMTTISTMATVHLIVDGTVTRCRAKHHQVPEKFCVD